MEHDHRRRPWWGPGLWALPVFILVAGCVSYRLQTADTQAGAAHARQRETMHPELKRNTFSVGPDSWCVRGRVVTAGLFASPIGAATYAIAAQSRALGEGRVHADGTFERCFKGKPPPELVQVKVTAPGYLDVSRTWMPESASPLEVLLIPAPGPARAEP